MGIPALIASCIIPSIDKRIKINIFILLHLAARCAWENVQRNNIHSPLIEINPGDALYITHSLCHWSGLVPCASLKAIRTVFFACVLFRLNLHRKHWFLCRSSVFYSLCSNSVETSNYSYSDT